MDIEFPAELRNIVIVVELGSESDSLTSEIGSHVFCKLL